MQCIQAKGIYKTYGNTYAVNGIDLDVQSGQVFGFLGPNGAGKSTSIKILTTLIKPTTGQLNILGIDALSAPLDVRKKIGVVLQQPSYEPTLTVEKSLHKYGMMWDVPKNQIFDRTEELITKFDLQEIRNKKNEDLSIGQRRRVQVAREFIHDMELLFLDEPTVGLDPSSRRKLMNFLKEQVGHGLTIFYTTHVLSEAEYLCDKIAIINNGKIVTVASPDELKNQFGKEKTIKIHISSGHHSISKLLESISKCKINVEGKTTVSIYSSKSETVLVQVLKILSENNIEVEDLSVMPTNLEEIFLKVVDNSNAPNY